MRVNGEAALEWWHARLQKAAVKVGDITVVDGRATLAFEDRKASVWRWSTTAAWAAATSGTKAQCRPNFRSAGSADYHDGAGIAPDRFGADASHEHEAGARLCASRVERRRHPRLSNERGGPRRRTACRGAAQSRARPSRRRRRASRRVPLARQGLRRLGCAFKGDAHPNSGKVDRYWFHSLYFREPNGILFEIATDGPGFAVDEPLDKLGETLVLPPFLEARRKQIEAGLKPL